MPRIDDDLLAARDIEGDRRLRMKSEFLVVLDLRFRRIVDDEIRLEVLQLLLRGQDEHIADEMRLPCDLDDEAHGHARVLVRTTESVDDEETLVGKLLLRNLLEFFPRLLTCRMVVVRIGVRGPPDRILGVLVHDDELVLRRTARKDARHDIHGIKLRELSLLKSREVGLHLFFEKLFIGRIMDDFLHAGNSVLCQIKFCHVSLPLS